MKHENHCCICGKSAPGEDATCGKPSCDEYLAEIRKEIAEEFRDDRKDGLIAALKERCKCDENWNLNRIQRWFYTIKLLICVLLHLQYRGDETYPDSVEAGVFANSGYGWSESWKTIEVGHGYVSGWWWGLENHSQ